jgi:PAS domain S-box-containing protein
MLILDFSGRLLLSNETARGMFGKSADELHSRFFQDFIHGDDLSNFLERFTLLALQMNSRFDLECRYTRENDTRWGRLAFSHVGTGDFSPFIFGIIEDITDQKTGEERLIRDKETAEKATQTKSAFLANMSHEIRTPIHTVTGMTELLLETKLDEEQKEYAKQIRYSAEVLLGLINDILDFSKIEAGKFSLEILDCDIISLTEEAVDMVSLLAHKKDLEVVLELDRNVSQWVKGDPVRIRQIIINLFNNAVKFTPQGEIIIRTRLLEGSGPLQNVQFEVIDTGIGISEDKLTMLFEAFTQVDSSTSRKFGGTGLGLSISKSLVRMMNGTIDVRSVKGKGSIFRFTLPLEVVLDHDEEAESIIEDSMQAMRVLLVDDNASARRVLKRIVGDWFRRVDTAANGPDALAMLLRAAEEGVPYGLAFVDLHMPGMDGWQFASEVNNNPAIKPTKLILMSPMGTGTEAKMKLLGWFNGYVNKPVKRHELLECVVNAVSTDSGIEASKTLAAEPGREPSEAEKRNHHVLVSEDHMVNQQLFQTILEKMGYTVFLASNGMEAVDQVRRERIDLVFMDVQMPEMNGYEASSRIRELGYTVPIVAVTANALKGEKERCLAAGMNDYLTKPFKGKDLVPYLTKWIVTSEGEEPAPLEELLPEETVSERDIFDFASAQDSFMGKKDVVVRVVKAFQKKIEEQFGSMAAALKSGDWKSLSIESHGIKGGSWNLQAKQLGDAAALLEMAAKEQDSKAAEAHLEDVKREYEVFRDYISGLPDFQDK